MVESTLAIAAKTKPQSLRDHNLVREFSTPGVRYEKRPVKTPDGTVSRVSTTPGSFSTTRSSTTPTRRKWSRA